MKVRELITELMKYDVDADFVVTINGLPGENVGFGFGSSRGDQPDKADIVELGITRSDLYQIKEGVETVVTEDNVAQEVQDQVSTPVQENPRAARVGSNVTQGKGNWFTGTSWGS